MYWAFLLAFGLSIISGFIIIFFFQISFKNIYIYIYIFFFWVYFHGFINQYGKKTRKETGYWFFGRAKIRPIVKPVTS